MLALIENGQFVKYVSEKRLDLPGNIVVMPVVAGWSNDNFEVVDVAPADPVPEGKQVVSSEPQLVDGQWRIVNVLEDIVPPTPEELRAQMPTLYPRQFRDALVDNSIMPDAVTAAIDGIPFEVERIKALNAWEYATEFDRLDPYIGMIGAMFDLTDEDIDAMWLAA